MGDSTQPAMCYPNTEQYERWKGWSDEMDMSVSEFIVSMVEAGWKQFDNPEPDYTNEELRQQRDDLKQELHRARRRIEKLEEELHTTERAKIVEFVENNPGVSRGDIIQEVADTVPNRVQTHLESMEGDRIVSEDSGYYTHG